MHAFEFQTKVRNGSIEIPGEYKDKITGSVRVIILAESEYKLATANMIDRLLTNPLKLDNFKPLTREQIYERD